MSLIETYQLNDIVFADNSLKPASTEVMTKLNTLIHLFAVHPHYDQSNYQVPMGSLTQQQVQYQSMLRQQMQPRPQSGLFNNGPWGEVESNTSVTQVTIKETSLSISIGQSLHVLTRYDGAWNHTASNAQSQGALSHYASLLCEEIIAGSK